MFESLTLPLFTQMLVPVGLAPALDYLVSKKIIYTSLPDLETRAKARFALGQDVIFAPGRPDEVERLTKHWRAELAAELDESSVAIKGNIDNDEQLRDLASDAPVIKMVNHLLEMAMDINASDIHFEPDESALIVRCRVDGIMTIIKQLPINAQPAVASRLKLMSRLDIGEKRLPQDGRIQYTLADKQLDMRVSTMPGIHGESIVLRILDRSDVKVSLSELGMADVVRDSYNKYINLAHGMVLVTGPTGSGKTTTLYATLEKILSEEKKIITVEDPVEYQLSGVTQVQVVSKIGLTFASGLRSIVRQDPDVIMIGEIRDRETAEIAVESALTGHMVFSTLHTNDAAGALTRMQDMGIESYLISSSVLAVLAQRLVRCFCPFCVQEQPLGTAEAALLEIAEDDYKTVGLRIGCERCAQTGYRGRIGVYELLSMSEKIRHSLAGGADSNIILDIALREGMQTLRQDGIHKMARKLTSAAEIIRVTQSVS